MKTIFLVIAAAFASLSIAYVSSLQAQSPYTHRTTPVSAELAFGAITGTNAGTANTLYTLLADCSIAAFENTTDKEISVLIGSTKKRVPTGVVRSYDLGAGNTRIASGTVIKVFASAASPTSGNFEFFCQPY